MQRQRASQFSGTFGSITKLIDQPKLRREVQNIGDYATRPHLY